jgi:phosphate-selective porin OprO/OprP
MIFNKKLALAVSGAVLLMAGQAALADSTTDIVDALISKGVLTEEEGKLISKGAKAKADATPTVKEKDGAFSISSPNGKNSIQLTGRMHFDARYNNLDGFGDESAYPWNRDLDSKSGASQFEMRRARLGAKGRIGGVADYLLQFNLAAGGAKVIDEAYIDINKFELAGLKLGMSKVPFGLEQLTSSNNIDFMERSYADQLSPAKKLNVQLHGERTGATYAGGLFQMNDSALSQKDHNLSTAGRVTANFAELMGNKDMIMHVGLAGYNSNYEMNTATSSNTSGDAETANRGSVFAFTSGGRGLANAYRMQIAGAEPGSSGLDNSSSATACSVTVPSGSSTAAQTLTCAVGTSTSGLNAGYNTLSPTTASVHTDRFGLEGILAWNNFKVQGEYSDASYKARSQGASQGSSGTDLLYATDMKADVKTWYAEALWLVTGEKYADAYKKGAFGALKPKNEFNMDSGTGYGLVELGFRVDAFDVNNTSNTGSDKSRFQGATDGVTTNSTSSKSKIDECSYTGSGVTTAANSCNGGATSYTAGVKWIWNPNIMFKANYTYTDYDNAFYAIDIGAKTPRVTGSTPNAGLKKIDHEDLFMIRGQYSF